MNDNTDDLFILAVTVTLELPGGWIIGSLALAAVTDALTRLEHEGIHPHRTTIDVTETTTH